MGWCSSRFGGAAAAGESGAGLSGLRHKPPAHVEAAVAIGWALIFAGWVKVTIWGLALALLMVVSVKSFLQHLSLRNYHLSNMELYLLPAVFL